MKIAGVGWWSAGGGDERYGEGERGRKKKKTREMDHPVSECIMVGRGGGGGGGGGEEADEQNWR